MKIKKSALAAFSVVALGMSFFSPVVQAGGPYNGVSVAPGSDLLNIVRVNGLGKVTAEPDVAVLNVGIETQGETSKQVQADNNTQSQKLIETLRELEIGEDDIKTQWYNISPNYDYRNEGGRKLLGYIANHSLNVTIRDLTKVSEVLDKVTESGATNVGNVQYTLEDRESAYDEARLLAAHNAKGKAEKLALVFGFEVGALVQVEEFINDYYMPMAERGMGAGGGGQDIIRPGDVEIQLSLNTVFEIKPGTGEMVALPEPVESEEVAPAETTTTEESGVENTQEETISEESTAPTTTETEEGDSTQEAMSESTTTEEAETQATTPGTEDSTEAEESATEEAAEAPTPEVQVTEEVIPQSQPEEEPVEEEAPPAELPEPAATDPQAPVEELAPAPAPEMLNLSEALATTLDEIVKVTGIKNVVPLQFDLLWFEGDEELEVPALGFEQEGTLGSHQIKVQFQNVVSYLQSKGFKTNADNTGSPTATEDMRGYEKDNLLCSVERIDDGEAQKTKLVVICGEK